MVNPSSLYLIPGLGGSELWDTNAPSAKLWVDTSRLVLGGLRQMALASDGYSPLPPLGIRLLPRGVLQSLYGAPWAQVAADPLLAGWDTIQWAYDWRKPLDNAGQILGLNILQNVTADAPCTLVGHSYGGAVARYAWSWLRASGREGLIRRIITLGTPHQGSYSVIKAMLGITSPLYQISDLQAQIVVPISLFVGSPRLAQYALHEIGNLIATWPSFYDLMPNPLGAAFRSDGNLDAAFRRQNWPSWSAISQAHLDRAREVLLPAAVDPANIPPPWVLTTIGSAGYITPGRLTTSLLTDDPATVASDASGDGQVELASALVPGSRQILYSAAHSDLVAATVSDGRLVAEVLDERSPPDPPPPPARVAGITPPTLGDPPLVPYLVSGGVGVARPFTSGRDP